MKRIVTLLTGVVFLMAIAAFAQTHVTKNQMAKEKAPVTHQASGTITSAEAGSLVLSHMVKGKEEQTTFVLNDQTKKEGNLQAGTKAMVHYRVEGGQNIATLVNAAVPHKPKSGGK